MSDVVLSPAARFSIDPDDLADHSNGASVSNSLSRTSHAALEDSSDSNAAVATPRGRGTMYLSASTEAVVNRHDGYRTVGPHEQDGDIPVETDTHDVQAAPAHMYGSFVGYCFTVNYILGVGVLGMPYAFYKGGWALSTLCLGLVSIMAAFTSLWLVDVSLRAQYVKRQDRLLREGGELDADPSVSGIVAVQPPISHRTHHRFEMNELTEMFMGQRARRFYEVLVIIYLVGALWSYTSVFASSLASHVGFPGINGGHSCDVYKDHSSACSSLYYLYVGFFALFAVPFSCMDLTEMKSLQIALALFRFVSLGTMMGTSIAAIYSYPVPEASAHSPPEAPYRSGDFQAFDWSNLGFVFPVAVFSQIFHHSVPGLSGPLNDKRKTPKMFTGVLVTTFALYTALGISVSAYYGGSIPQTCTLAWADYSGGHDGAGASRPGWAWFISYMIVLFPPLDIISAYPLNAITLGNNLLTAFVTDERAQQSPRYRIPFRLLAAIPPIVGAIVVKDLGIILKYTGCVGVLIAFAYPCALQYRSVLECKRRGLQVAVEASQAEGSSFFRRMKGSFGIRSFSDVSNDASAPLSPRRAIGLPSYNSRWVSDPRIVAVVFGFSIVGLIAVLVLSIAGLS